MYILESEMFKKNYIKYIYSRLSKNNHLCVKIEKWEWSMVIDKSGVWNVKDDLSDKFNGQRLILTSSVCDESEFLQGNGRF